MAEVSQTPLSVTASSSVGFVPLARFPPGYGDEFDLLKLLPELFTTTQCGGEVLFECTVKIHPSCSIEHQFYQCSHNNFCCLCYYGKIHLQETDSSDLQNPAVGDHSRWRILQLRTLSHGAKSLLLQRQTLGDNVGTMEHSLEE